MANENNTTVPTPEVQPPIASATESKTPEAPKEEPKSTPTPTPPPLPSQRRQAETQPADDLKAQLTALQTRLDTMEHERTTDTRTKELERIIAPLSDTLKAVYRRTPLATLSDEDFAQLLQTIEQEVKELDTVAKTRGAVFTRPTNSNKSDTKATDTEIAEVLRRLNI